MLFQGQEFGSSAPFQYFAHHDGDLAAAVARGRREFMSQFPSQASSAMQARLPLPHDRATFERCRLDWSEYDAHVDQVRLHADLIALRRTDAAFRAQARVEGAVLAAEAFVLRFAGGSDDEERLLLVNLGGDLKEGGFTEPLMAPPAGHRWDTAWSSEAPEYGGLGVGPVVDDDGWVIPGQSATVLRPVTSG
jgi:maltooligosyltrehalose trehalohydrolase